MRRFGCVTLCAILAIPAAWAQTATVVPPAPPIVSAPPVAPAPALPPAGAPPPGLVQTPAPPASASTPPDGNADNGTPVVGAATPAAPPAWVPGTTAQLGVLDKVDGSVSQPAIDVGGQSTVGDLQISVLACVTRPPDQIPDAAVFLSIQALDNISGPPLFRGWIVRSTPAAAVVGNASESLRIINCT